jgi:hypothetical protein
MSSPTTLQKRWRELMDAKMRNIKTIKQLEEGDENVKKIMEQLRVLYGHKIDSVPPDELANIGGKLLGHYASVGTTTSIKRAERDAAEQSYEELLSAMTIMHKDSETGITEARAIAKEEMSDFATEIVWRTQHKNAYEAITDSTEKTISFIQSLMKIKMAERMGGKLNEAT